MKKDTKVLHFFSFFLRGEIHNPQGSPTAIAVFFFSGNIVSSCAEGNDLIPTGREGCDSFQPDLFPAQVAVPAK